MIHFVDAVDVILYVCVTIDKCPTHFCGRQKVFLVSNVGFLLFSDLKLYLTINCFTFVVHKVFEPHVHCRRLETDFMWMFITHTQTHKLNRLLISLSKNHSEKIHWKLISCIDSNERMCDVSVIIMAERH